MTKLDLQGILSIIELLNNMTDTDTLTVTTVAITTSNDVKIEIVWDEDTEEFAVVQV